MKPDEDYRVVLPEVRKKSDQGGIETTNANIQAKTNNTKEIRPRWD